MIIGGFPEPIRQWGKAFLILFFAHRYGAQCTAVEGVVHRENMPVPSFIISVPPSQFHGTFQCLCSAVTEKNTIQSGDFYQFFCKIALRFIVVKIRDVNQLFSLLLNGLYNVGVAMAKVIHRDTCQCIDILITLIVPHFWSLPANKGTRVGSVLVD